MSSAKTVFDLRRGDEWIRVWIDGDSATLLVVGIVIEALKQAALAGARRGTMFTGEIVENHAAAMHRMRAATGTT